MTKIDGILAIIREHYPIRFDKLEYARDAGSVSYTVFSRNIRYFLRVIKPAFLDSAMIGSDIQVFLQNDGFPVPAVIITNDDLPYIKTDDGLFILYEFIEGSESNPEQDAENIGSLVGRLHNTMVKYTGKLIKRDKYFFIERYIEILNSKQYPRTDEFLSYGNDLWDKIKNLPRGYCHGDLYCGNIHKTPEGKFYMLDFDTSCEGFPMYDPTLICDKTNYFNFDEWGYRKSKEILERFLPEYLKYQSLSQNEIIAFYDLIALCHFALQATVIENNGLNCVDNHFLDKQLDWLIKWRNQCASGDFPINSNILGATFK
jgi:Ser/Thr protein kinase RdoA (MazF antagonist)